MIRGKNWDFSENEGLAKAWVQTSKDAILGTDRPRKFFKESFACRLPFWHLLICATVVGYVVIDP